MTKPSDKTIIKTLDLSPETPPNVRNVIEKSAERIAQALPKHIEAQRFIRSAVLAAVREPRLLKACIANPVSLASAVMEAAELGLDFSPSLGLAALVPFNNRVKENGQWRTVPTVTMIPMFRGLATLARRTCNVQISADCVFDGDVFRHRRGTDPGIDHEPRGEHKDKDKITHAYAVAHYPDNRRPQFLVMTKAQIEDIRLHFSKQSEGKLWGGDDCPAGERDNNYHEACRKTVVRRLCKELDLSPELLRAIELTDREFDRNVEVPAPPEGRRQFGFGNGPKGGEPIDTTATDKTEDPQPSTDGKTETTEPVPSTDGDDPGLADPGKSRRSTQKPQPKLKPKATDPEPEPEQQPEPTPEKTQDHDDGVPDVPVDERWPCLVDMVATKLNIKMDDAEEKLANWLAGKSISYLAIKKNATWEKAYTAVTGEESF